MRMLNDWFQNHKRDLPWRADPTPYRVWISEVMLQQTRATVVIPYFEKWMRLFPDVATLAHASLDAVIKAWEGLGYYSRARNLHKGAQQIVERFGGEIPSTREELMSIQGLGPYTVNAILSFGFRKRAAPVDGNVTRVLARFFAIEDNVCKQAVKRKIAQGAEALLTPDEPWVTAEALIELGATICTPRPRCEICPLNKNCLGKERAHLLPIKNIEKELTQLKRAVLWIEAVGKVLVKKGEPGKIMADLYEFPYFEMEELWPIQKIKKAILAEFGLKPQVIGQGPQVTHTFTRYKATLFPFKFRLKTPQEIVGYEWVEQNNLSKLPFSSGHRRILHL
ncbi:MAG: A/G-specific adenine glycosylase [Verrucomicrobia bacterium]|nr:A/G-specific adenine glycosylase [Verrucomicrobiota bacterium]MBU6446142.1 A/G-specific adenine glycosylase [Verrucomicrobiota bacterium]MDE3046736.1 A/G-specific adenine glycosylase [Verrucomicrobiota bacterium]